MTQNKTHFAKLYFNGKMYI